MNRERMRIVTWNVNRARANRPTWRMLKELNPDIAFLQEVGEIPAGEFAGYNAIETTPITRDGHAQRFRSLLMVRGGVDKPAPLTSSQPWTNEQLARFGGNVYVTTVRLASGQSLRVLHAYCPPWPLETANAPIEEVKALRFPTNPSVWLTNLLRDAICQLPNLADSSWVMAGDLNLSETLDRPGQPPRGNKDFLERMAGLGLTECLRHHQQKVVPTYRHSKGSIIHQIDHIFVSQPLLHRLRSCRTADTKQVFGPPERLSDHLPIVADFDIFCSSIGHTTA